MSRLNETYFNGYIDYNISPTQRLYVRYLKDIGELDAPDNTVTPRRILATNKPDNIGGSELDGQRPVSERIQSRPESGPDYAECSARSAGLEGTLINISGSIVPGRQWRSGGVAAPGGTTRSSPARAMDAARIIAGKRTRSLTTSAILRATIRSRPASSSVPSAYR